MSTDAILATLTGGDPALRTRAARLVVDQVLATPLSQLLSPAELTELSLQAIGDTELERAIERHVAGGITRLRARLAADGGTVGDAVPDELHGPILDLIGDTDGPRFAWTRGALDPSLLRDLLAPVFQDVLVGFAAKAPGALGGAAGGAAAAGAGALMGALGSSAKSGAGRLLNVGRSVVGGLGKELEGTLRHAAKDFSRGAVSAFQESLRKRLKSQEGREILSQLQQGAFDHVMAVELKVIDEDLERLNWDGLLSLAPPLVAHNLARELGNKALAEAMEAYFEIEGQRPLAEVLDDWGVREPIADVAAAHGEGVAKALFASDDFRAWLDDVLKASDA